MLLLPSIQSRLPSLTLSQFSLLLSLWLGLALNISFYGKLKALTPYTGFKSGLFIVASMIVVIAAYHLLMQILLWRATAKVLSVGLLIIGGFSSYFVSSLGVTISPDQIQNMMQTDFKESRDLLSWTFLQWIVLFVLCPVTLFILIPIRKRRIRKELGLKALHMLLAAVFMCGSLFIFYVDYAAIFREHRDLKGMISPQNVITSTASYYRKQSPQAHLPLIHYGTDAHRVQTTQQSETPKLMVLVVGETARAESFALNHYQKNTNPELQKQAILNFSQVSSCGTATAVSVPCMFSGMQRNNYDEQLAGHREGLLDIAQRAGYKVTWIDNNSGCKGVCNRVEQYPIPEDLKAKWCDADQECYDEILVDSLKRYIAQIKRSDKQPRLIVLHQMGSHGPAYYKRSPPPFQRFQPMCNSKAIQGCSQQELINSYDNSIAYTDHVLSATIDTLKHLHHYQSAFWYLSDHGESTGEHGLYLHGSPYAIAPQQQTHIPMILWFSPQWQKHNIQHVNCLKHSQQKILSQDDLFSTLLNVLDIKSNVMRSEFNLLQQCNIPTKRRSA